MSTPQPNTRAALRESAAPATTPPKPDAVADVVVVGGGGGGLPAALFSRWLGDEVILLEKADQLGGTARKAAFWYWVPNNRPLREAGLTDREEDYLRFVARLSRPTMYDATKPTLGVPQEEYDAYRAIYESASPAAELLNSHGALPYRHVPTLTTTGRKSLRTRPRRAEYSSTPMRKSRWRTEVHAASRA